jgi:hypothetical protein
MRRLTSFDRRLVNDGGKRSYGPVVQGNRLGTPLAKALG